MILNLSPLICTFYAIKQENSMESPHMDENKRSWNLWEVRIMNTKYYILDILPVFHHMVDIFFSIKEFIHKLYYPCAVI
jgi:hypothetical protein